MGRYGRSHLITLVERHSRCLVVIPIPNATSGTVIAELIAMFALLPETMRKSLTWDRGIEMTRHEQFTQVTGIPVYFCNAYSPWQRGSNENTDDRSVSTSPRRPTYPFTAQSTSSLSSTKSTGDPVEP